MSHGELQLSAVSDPRYLEFTALLILLHCVMFLFLHKVNFYIDLLGFIALGLEATVRRPRLCLVSGKSRF